MQLQLTKYNRALKLKNQIASLPKSSRQKVIVNSQQQQQQRKKKPKKLTL